MNHVMIVGVLALLIVPVYGQEANLPDNIGTRVLLDNGKWIEIGSSESYNVEDAVLCDSPVLVKQFIDSSFLVGHYPLGCGPYEAGKSDEGKVPVTLTYLENYDGRGVVVEFDPVEEGLKSFYGCFRIKLLVAAPSI